MPSGPPSTERGQSACAAATSLGTVAALGLPNLITRRVAELNSQQNWDALSSTLSRSLRITALASVLIAAVAIAIPWISGSHGSLNFVLFALAAAALPFTTLTNAWGASLRGLGHGVLAQSVPTIARPLMLVIGVGAISLLLPKGANAELAMGVNLVGAAAALIATAALYYKLRPAPLAIASRSHRISGLWQECMPFMLVSIMGVVGQRVDLFLIGALLDSHAAGLFEVAYRGADLVLLPLTATTAVIAPEFARRFSLKDHAGLQKLVTQSARGLVLLSAPIALLLILAAEPIIRTIFGAEYAAGARTMAVLSGGTLMMLLLGPVHVVLGMVGRSSASAVGAFAGIALGGCLSALLIPRFGIEGAAIGRSIGQWLAAGWLAWYALRRVGVTTWALLVPGRRIESCR